MSTNVYPLTDHVNQGVPADILGRLFRNIPGATNAEADVFAALAQIANHSAFLTVRPVWDSPSFWAKPLTATRIHLQEPTAGDWVDYLTVQTNSLVSAVVKQYVATVEGDSETSGIEFRILYNRGVLDTAQFVSGMEKNKTGPNDYPVVNRSFYQVLDNSASLTLQVKNNGASDRRVIAAFYGWTYNPYSVDGTGNKSGLVDTQLS